MKNLMSILRDKLFDQLGLNLTYPKFMAPRSYIPDDVIRCIHDEMATIYESP